MCHSMRSPIASQAPLTQRTSFAKVQLLHVPQLQQPLQCILLYQGVVQHTVDAVVGEVFHNSLESVVDGRELLGRRHHASRCWQQDAS